MTVNNVAPTIAISGAASVNEGSPYSLTLGAVTDPGTDTVTSYIVHWGDGSTDTYASNGVKTHTYADGPNTTAITVDLVDEDGTFLDRANALSVHRQQRGPDDRHQRRRQRQRGLALQPDPGRGHRPRHRHRQPATSSTGATAAPTPTPPTASRPTPTPTAPTPRDHGRPGRRGRHLPRCAPTRFSVTVNNVAPTVGTVTVTFDPITHVATATASITDPGELDTHTATVTWNVAGTGPTVTLTESLGNGSVTGKINLPTGCYSTLTATIAVTDKDSGVGTRAGSLVGSADAYAASFQAPIQDNERNIAKFGNVVPIKVSLVSSCTGAAVTTASLYITLTPGLNGEFIDDTNIVAESVSSADTGNLMRLNGGGYIFNLTTKGLTQGTDYAVRIRTGSTTGPMILQAILQPKK